jgi:hypothetical protein
LRTKLKPPKSKPELKYENQGSNRSLNLRTQNITKPLRNQAKSKKNRFKYSNPRNIHSYYPFKVASDRGVDDKNRSDFYHKLGNFFFNDHKNMPTLYATMQTLLMMQFKYGKCEISWDRIGEIGEFDRSALRTTLPLLIEAGLIRRIRNGKKKDSVENACNTYRFDKRFLYLSNLEILQNIFNKLKRFTVDALRDFYNLLKVRQIETHTVLVTKEIYKNREEEATTGHGLFSPFIDKFKNFSLEWSSQAHQDAVCALGCDCGPCELTRLYAQDATRELKKHLENLP